MNQLGNPEKTLSKKIQLNCDISDARDHGIYSICILVLKLRNLYKWQMGLDPWDEPEPAVMLDWIDTRENYWQTISEEEFKPLIFDNLSLDPFDIIGINNIVSVKDLYYGAGYGRSMKPVFFLAEILEQQTINECSVVILGKEQARELSGPFALRQEDQIIIRKEQLRFFLWDHLQEILPSAREIMMQVLKKHTAPGNSCRLSNDLLKQELATIVDQEIPTFIHHEIGEMQQTPLGSGVLKSLISEFPDSLIEFFSRSVKDILADTHSKGMLQYIVQEKNELSLGFYISFLNGIRKKLFPEITTAAERFLLQGKGGWETIEEARESGWKNNLKRARMIADILNKSENNDQITHRFKKELFAPLGLGT